ncbi:MAG: dihydrofolate reductase family protein, partial [Candidatus Saccharimonadales bacterium]
MRKLIATEFVSVDGVMGEPQNWTAAYFSPEMGEYRHKELFASGALLLGRVTYDSFADVWPARPGLDRGEQAYADRLNSMPKYVVSQSMETAEWENTSVINDDVEAAVAALKTEDGQDILIHGSATLVNYLLNAGL